MTMTPPRPLLVGWLPLVVTLGALLAALVAITAALAADAFAIRTLDAFGLKDDRAIAAGEIGRLVRAGLVHVSWTHLAVNALALALIAILYWRVHPPPERTPRSAFLLVALCVVTSTAGFTASHLLAMGLSCGASAAVYGLFGATAARVWRLRERLPERVRLFAPLSLTAISLASAVILLPTAGIDHAAHLSGWASGFALGFVTASRLGGFMLLAAGATLVLIAAILPSG